MYEALWWLCFPAMKGIRHFVAGSMAKSPYQIGLKGESPIYTNQYCHRKANTIPIPISIDGIALNVPENKLNLF